MKQRRFVLLDRDGTILVDRHYLADPDRVELIDGAAEGLRKLARLGLGLAVVTNQSGIGRGYFDAVDLERVHREMTRRLAEEGVELQGIYWCPHRPEDHCGCRKPGTGLAERAARELRFDPSRAFVIGDKAADIELGEALGAVTLLVRTGHGAETEKRAVHRPDHAVDGLREAAEAIARDLDAERER